MPTPFGVSATPAAARCPNVMAAGSTARLRQVTLNEGERTIKFLRPASWEVLAESQCLRWEREEGRHNRHLLDIERTNLVLTK
jgi:hypothetical protein